MPRLLSLLRVAAVTLCLGSLAACTTTGGQALVDSQVSAEISGQAARAIADDMVSQLADHVGPGTTTIALKGDDEPFGPALEASLRTKGYAVLTGQETDDTSAVPLAYVINPFESGVLVRVSTARLELTRVYALSATGAAPASPMSVMQRGTAGTP
ncbi:MAG: conjugal transfer protein TrbH [Rhodobiaceae bacterium]|nr:conjugal transfer protein TrbH [Rhodobiaceae bacterium]